MHSVTLSDEPRKGAPSDSLTTTIETLLAKMHASEMPAFARHVLRSAYRQLTKAPIPKRHGSDLRSLVRDVLALPGATIEAIYALCEKLRERYNDASPAIQVDSLLRGTIAADMPADVRSVLRTIAGHSDVESREAWPDRETLAGESGVCLNRLDAILRKLVEYGWIFRWPRRRPDGMTTSSGYSVHPEKGRWWPEAARATKQRTFTPSPATPRHEVAVASPHEAASPPRHGVTVAPCHEAQSIHSLSIHLERTSEAGLRPTHTEERAREREKDELGALPLLSPAESSTRVHEEIAPPPKSERRRKDAQHVAEEVALESALGTFQDFIRGGSREGTLARAYRLLGALLLQLASNDVGEVETTACA